MDTTHTTARYFPEADWQRKTPRDAGLDPAKLQGAIDHAIAAERLGIPAVAVITDRFEPGAKVVAQVNGLPGYPFSVIPHPIANNDDALLREKAERAVTRIVELLTQRA